MKQVNNRINVKKLAVKSAVFVSALSIMTLPIIPAINIATGSADSSTSYTTLSAFSGFPAATLTVSGGGFAANEAIKISATQDGTQVASANATATDGGDYRTSLTLPARLAQGAVNIKATGMTSGFSSSNAYYVTPFSPSLTAGTDTTPYSTVTIGGSGYAPNETVALNLAGATATAKADATGAFKNATLVTPDVPAGSYTIIGVGQESGARTVFYEYINGFYPSASPSSYYVMPMTSFGFNGSGFAPGETVTVKDVADGSQVSSFVTDAKGGFTNGGAFQVPSSYAGLTKKFVLTGTTSNATTTTSTVIGRYYPNVSPTAFYVQPGGSLAFNGNGFLPGETVEIFNGTTKIATVQADAKGNLAAAGETATTAAQAGTVQTYTLKGLSSMGTGNVSVQIGSYNPQASPSGYYVMPGTVVTFSGNGYAPSEIVTIFSGTVNLGNFTTGVDGSFLQAGSVMVDYSKANGSLDYKLVGSVSNKPINFSIGVGQMQVMLTPSSYYVLPYEEFSVTANGFAPNEDVELGNDKQTLQTQKTDADGTVTFNKVFMPYADSGELFATGKTSMATAQIVIGIGSYHPSVVADNYYAKPGTTITLNGNGYAPSEAVKVTMAGETYTTTADEDGVMEIAVTLPFGQPTNSVDISARGQMSQAEAVTTITLAPYTAQISPSTYYAQPGTAVTFEGNGFLADEKLEVYLNGKLVATETATANGELVSTATYTLPYGKAANYQVVGLGSGAKADVSIGLAQFYAGVQLDSYYGKGGSTVTANGSGFATNEVVKLTSNGANLGTVTTNAKGDFSKAVVMPYAAAGKIDITATGATSGAESSTNYTVAQAYNSVYLGSYAVPAGKNVTILGDGFFGNEPITVTADRGGVSYSFTADNLGNVRNSGLVLPADLAEGELTLTIKGSYSYTTSNITFYVQDASVAN